MTATQTAPVVPARRLRLVAALVSAVGAALLCALVGTAIARSAVAFHVSYTAGSADRHGKFMGGTELRALTAYEGKLYAGNGYWMDQPGTDGAHGAQVLALDSPTGRWRVAHEFGAQLPGGAPAQFAVSALRGVTFTTGAHGQRLRRPVSMLLASVWDRRGISQVFDRSDATGTWTTMNLAAPATSSTGLQQVRALGFHRDRTTGADLAFAGNNRYGIFSGVYDQRAPGHIRWSPRPELNLYNATTNFPGLGGRLRVTSFAECNGVLYAAVGQQIYRRLDGAAPRWQLVYTNDDPGYSQSGLRGLTAVRNTIGSGQVLLAAVEGTRARMLRVDPAAGYRGTTELNLNGALAAHWGARVSYSIGAYNDMTAVPDGHGGTDLLIGVEGHYRSGHAPIGHTAFYGYDAGAWYLVRTPAGQYRLREIAGAQPVTKQPLVSTRAIALSPFAGRAGGVYFGGFDANSKPVHNTAWIFRTPLSSALG
jgi:hypothetical protein